VSAVRVRPPLFDVSKVDGLASCAECAGNPAVVEVRTLRFGAKSTRFQQQGASSHQIAVSSGIAVLLQDNRTYELAVAIREKKGWGYGS
jgi:hypothetical protein